LTVIGLVADMANERDRGVVTAFVLGLAMCFMVTAGLAVDGGRIVAARVEAADHAENAARVAAQQVTLLRLGWRLLDPIKARRAAEEYLSTHGVGGQVTIGLRTVTVTVMLTQQTTLLRLAGIGRRTVTATRSAELVES
jgi:hypothetical protein